ncbi:putative NADPH dehydrogenase [delta proteobacterium NaphS2]|nr:putative NADPH dehydrogenase [delta proteobacterium NaphS2]
MEKIRQNGIFKYKLLLRGLKMTKTLFSTIKLRELTFKNRIFVSPMCQYSSQDGLPGDWHMVHLGSRAVGGAALVMVEATAVSPEGRISPWDSGIWSDIHAEAFKKITTFIKERGAVPAIQLAHAGRKASTDVPWRDDKPLGEEEGGWMPVAPSPIPFSSESPLPRKLEPQEIERLTSRFVEGARRSLNAGFEVLEIHMAHGYLLHEFLSPVSNNRRDLFGGSLDNRVRFPLEVARAVRGVWPERLPLFVRISCTDWVEGAWDLDQSITFCRMLKEEGVDLIDCSSGGMVPDAVIPAGPGFQVPFAASIRKEVGIPTGAVGVITSAVQAEQITATGQADVVLLAREMLRDPYWPLHAAKSLRVDVPWPEQYERGKPGVSG